MTFEILDINLYGGLKQRAEEVYLKKLTCQILNALVTIDSLNIIHCDIKMRTYSAIQEVFGSKLIDFESSCFTDQQIYSYIQSRYYRAPEVTLQMPYTSTIGIWSMVCVLVKCILENHLKGSKRQFYSILRYLPLLSSFRRESDPKSILTPQARLDRTSTRRIREYLAGTLILDGPVTCSRILLRSAFTGFLKKD